MARAKLDKERAAKVVAMADQAGDEAAAKHFGLSTKSVQRYRKLGLVDVQLSAAIRERKQEFEKASEDWAIGAARFMVKAISKADLLVEKAEVGQLRDVMGAIKIVGELDITRKVLGGGERPTVDRPGPASTEAEDGPDRGEGAAGARGAGSAEAGPGPRPVH